MAKLLLESGANIHHVDITGNSALAYALSFVPSPSESAISDDMLGLLLGYGAKINEPDDNGYTPLMHATHQGALRLVQLLLRHGALWVSMSHCILISY